MGKKSTYLLILSLTLFNLFLYLGFRHAALAYEKIAIFEKEIEENVEFGIFGPDELCLYYGSIIGDFSGGGLPTDVFSWRILKEDGSLVISREGGFQTFSFTFSEEGLYVIHLSIRRGTDLVYSGSKEVKINLGANIILQNSYLICKDGVVELSLIHPEDPGLPDYFIEWKDQIGNIVGTGNTVSLNSPGVYRVDFYSRNEQGQIVCPFTQFTTVSFPEEYFLNVSESEVCFGWREIDLSTNSIVPGTWYFQKLGAGNRVLLGERSNITFNVLDLDGPGDYELIFEVDNSDNVFCKLEDRIPFTLLPQAEIDIDFVSDAGNCSLGNGAIQINLLTDVDRLQIIRVDQVIEEFFNLTPSDSSLIISGLSSGVYSIRYSLGNCTSFMPFVIGLEEQDAELKFEIVEIIPETCTETGKQDGKIKVRMENGPFNGSYRILSVNGLPYTEDELPGSSGVITNLQEFQISLRSGFYFLELMDENGCVLPTSEGFRILNKDQVSFDVPIRLNICGEYEFIPITDQNLWFELTYPDNQVVTKLTGEPFTLFESGNYTIRGLETDPERGLCPREMTFRVVANEAIVYEPVLVSQDCFGNKTYQAEVFGRDPSNLIFTWYNEKNQVVGNGQFLFPTSFGEFKLDVQVRNAEPCPNPPKRFTVNQAVLEVEVDIIEAQYCQEKRYSILSIITDFDQAEYFEWIFIDNSGNSFNLNQFNGLSEIKIEEYGFYEVVVYNERGCEIGRKIEEVRELIGTADFSIPEELVVCENYNLVPETSLDFEFKVITPTGDQIIFTKGEPIILDKEGEYIVESMASIEDEPLCRIIKKINVKIAQPIDFEVVLVREDCEGNLIYKAEIFNEDPDLFDFYWYEASGNVIGTDQFLQLSSFGEYQLDVRPKNSVSCPRPLKDFTAEQPIVSIDISLEGLPICPDPGFTYINLISDLSLFTPTIKWYHTDSQGNRIEKDGFENETVVAVMEEGLYEVEVYNSKGCLLANEAILISKSQDQLRPEVDEEYVFCPSLGEIPEIDPGQFNQYEWYLEGSLLHEGSTFMPSEPGNYTLIVTSSEGCRFSTSFIVKEDCKLQLAYPNAIVQGDPERNFVIFTNYLVDEVSVWIYNKWGQLLFHCLDANVVENKVSCEWDGKFQGEYIPPGSYAVKIEYKNKADNIVKSEIRTLMVFDKAD
ncbi:hypothetical protein [Cecembia calidifontis]|nr:hypothetical protein [Cecembia calidifontis]